MYVPDISVSEKVTYIVTNAPLEYMEFVLDLALSKVNNSFLFLW